MPVASLFQVNQIQGYRAGQADKVFVQHEQRENRPLVSECVRVRHMLELYLKFIDDELTSTYSLRENKQTEFTARPIIILSSWRSKRSIPIGPGFPRLDQTTSLVPFRDRRSNLFLRRRRRYLLEEWKLLGSIECICDI